MGWTVRRVRPCIVKSRVVRVVGKVGVEGVERVAEVVGMLMLMGNERVVLMRRARVAR